MLKVAIQKEADHCLHRPQARHPIAQARGNWNAPLRIPENGIHQEDIIHTYVWCILVLAAASVQYAMIGGWMNPDRADVTPAQPLAPNMPEAPFGGKLFEQYQLFVEETARISDRRHSTSNLFLSVNSILLGAVALLIQQSADKHDALLLFLSALLVAPGLILCIFWYQFLLKYAHRLGLRFSYLSQLERNYPDELLPIYSNDKLRSQSFSHLEARIPLVFLATYLLAIAGALAFLFGLLAPLQSLLHVAR